MFLHPISHNILEAYVQPTVPLKSQLFASIIPNDPKTFTDLTKEQRMEQYAKSWFGWSYGADWEDQRIYEMLATGCIPFFIPSLKECPQNVLSNLPKKLILQAQDLYESVTASNQVEIKKQLAEIANKLLEYTKNHLTTEQMAKKVLEVVDNPKKVLYVLGTAEESVTLHKGIAAVVKDKVELVNGIEDKDKLNSNSYDSNSYDAVIFGDVHGVPEELLNMALKMYNPLKVVMICWKTNHDCGYVTKPCHLFLADPTVL